MHAVANLTCKSCGAALHKTVYAETVEGIYNVEIQCPCGAMNGMHRCIPTVLWKTAISFTLKGYKIANVFLDSMCIQFNGTFFRDMGMDVLNTLKLPDEFSLDIMEDGYDMLYNERVKLNDFEGMNKEEYIEKCYKELEAFADSLPTVGVNVIINLDIPLEDNTIEGEEKND